MIEYDFYLVDISDLGTFLQIENQFELREIRNEKNGLFYLGDDLILSSKLEKFEDLKNLINFLHGQDKDTKILYEPLARLIAECGRDCDCLNRAGNIILDNIFF